MHFDDMLKIVGEFGRYQRVQCFIVSLIVMNTTMHAFNMVFTAATPKHRCKVKNDTWEYKTLKMIEGHNYTTFTTVDDRESSCMVYIGNDTDLSVSSNYTAMPSGHLAKCDNGWIYDTDIYSSTIVTEWDLVCNNDWYQSMIMSVFFAGRLIGPSIFGQLSDWFGRRPILMLCIVCLPTSGLIASFCKSLWLLTVCVFCQGLAQFGLYNCAFILGTEMVGPSYRIHVTLSIHTCFGIGEVVTAGIAYLLRKWNFILLTISLSGIPFLLTYWQVHHTPYSAIWIVPESVRWLLARGKLDEANSIVKRVARTNGKTVDPEIINNLEVSKSKNRSTVFDLVRSWSITVLSLNVFFQGLALYVVFYGIGFNTPHLAGDPYLNFAILGFSEICCMLLLFCIRNRFGQKTKYLMFMAIAGVGCLALAFIPKGYRWLTILFAFIGKFGSSGASPYLNLITLEVFPTTLRNTAFGVGKTFAMMGAILTPYVIYLNNIRDELPEIIFGVLALLAVITAWFIPDTSGMNLPQNISDMRERSDRNGHTQLRILDQPKEDGFGSVTFVPETSR